MKKIAFALLLATFLSISTAFANESSDQLDKVLENQSQILAKLDEIKSELRIVKIRATEK